MTCIYIWQAVIQAWILQLYTLSTAVESLIRIIRSMAKLSADLPKHSLEVRCIDLIVI